MRPATDKNVSTTIRSALHHAETEAARYSSTVAAVAVPRPALFLPLCPIRDTQR
jgi:hypothetical protein